MQTSEARLGILGGMGPQATQIFYQRIIDLTDAACDQEHLPTLIWSDTQIPDRTACILGGEEERVFTRLAASAQLLERAGCSLLAIPCNTSHYFWARLQQTVQTPILNMIQLSVAALRAQGIGKVGILATDGTVQMQLYQKACAAAGIQAITPPPALQKLVMSIIYDEIKRGESGSREKFARVDAGMRALGCERLLLGCTELSVYRNTHALPDFYVDAMEILAQTAITRCGKTLRSI